jgi:hypothetical protein
MAVMNAIFLLTALAFAEPAAQASALGGTDLDLGSDQHLHIDKDGTIWLDREIMALGNVGLDPYANVWAHRLTRDRITVAVGIQIPHMQEPDTVLLAEIDLLNDRVEWSAVVPTPILGVDKGSRWNVVFGDAITLVQREHVVVAIDMRTGTQAWAFASADPTFEDDYLGGLRTEAGGITIDELRVDGREVTIGGRRRNRNEDVQIELDLATGRRIYAKTERKPIAPQPLFAFSGRMRPQVYDGPLPSPPAQPQDYDGLIVGYTTLVWNTKTAQGLVLNPTADALGDIVALARAQRVTMPDGTTKPIEWLLAIDTGTLATEMVVGPVAQPKKPPPAPSIWFDYEDGLADSGEVVDADSCAAALGIPALRSRVDLRDVPKAVRVRQQQWGAVDLVFGPLAFHDDTHRWAVPHVRR